MLTHNEYLLNKTQRQHRDELMHAAAQARLVHLAMPAQASRLDRTLAACGRVLV